MSASATWKPWISIPRAGRQLTAAVGALRFRDSSRQGRSRSRPWPTKREPDERHAQVRQTQRPSTPAPEAEKSAFPESDCLVTADAVPAWKVPRRPTEGASSMVENDQQQPCTLPSCVKYKKRNFRIKRKRLLQAISWFANGSKVAKQDQQPYLDRGDRCKIWRLKRASVSTNWVNQLQCSGPKQENNFCRMILLKPFFSNFTPLANFWLAKFPVSTLTHFPMQIMPTEYFLSQRIIVPKSHPVTY